MDAKEDSSSLSIEAKQHLERAYKYDEQDEFDKALIECELAIELAPNLAEAHNLLGLILDELNRKEEAVAAYRKAVRLGPAFQEAHKNLIEAEIDLKEEAEEVSFTLHSIESPPYLPSHSKDKNIAFILEIVPAFFGFLGFGWIYSGNTNTGILCLIGFIVWEFIALIILFITAGFGIFCVIPFHFGLIATSVYYLNTYIKQHPELFGPSLVSQQQPLTSQTSSSRTEQTALQSSFTNSEPSAEAMEHFNRAMNIWGNTEESKWDDNLRRDVCSELALAVHKANAPFPRANAVLAIFFNELGDDNKADYYARTALHQNPNEFRAQVVRLDVSVKGVRIAKITPGHIIGQGRKFEDVVAGTVGNIIGIGIAAGHAGITQSNFKNEVIKLVQIFRNVCQTNTDADEFLMMANGLISLGDFIKDMPMPGERPNLYAEVLNAPIDKLDKTNREEEIQEVLRRAEGRTLLF